jgi:hypothetical protein
VLRAVRNLYRINHEFAKIKSSTGKRLQNEIFEPVRRGKLVFKFADQAFVDADGNAVLLQNTQGGIIYMVLVQVRYKHRADIFYLSGMLGKKCPAQFLRV